MIEDFSILFYKNTVKSNIIYCLLIFLILTSILSLPFFKTSISIKSSGITRPKNERTELKPVLSGIIDSLLVKEGDSVLQGQLLATIKDNSTQTRLILNDFELTQRLGFINDLEQLKTLKDYNNLLLRTPFYRQQNH
jgi:multidrug efflux pump subunit AcrA (membrane-fusion protein)